MSERDETREAVARAIDPVGFEIVDQQYPQGYRGKGAAFMADVARLNWARAQADAALGALKPGSRFTVEGVECVVVPKPDASLLWKMTEILGEWIMDQKSEDDVFRAMLRACEEKGDG